MSSGAANGSGCSTRLNMRLRSALCGWVMLSTVGARPMTTVSYCRRSIVRRYPDFDDARAALALSLWSLGKRGEAESNWARVDDTRYKSREWLQKKRHWPPRLVTALTAFQEIRAV